MMSEIWKPVIGYEGLYEVSNCGRVRSLFRYKKILKPSISQTGYATVELFKDKVRKRVLVHRIVAAAFIPNPDNLPIVNHKDETRANNRAENLEWCTHQYNITYGTAPARRIAHTDYTKPIYKQIAIENGKAVSRPVEQYSKSGEFIARYPSAKEAHRQTGISHSHILECCAGKRYKTVGSFVWKYERGNDLLVFQS